MEMVEDYVNKGNTMQRRDAQDIIDEFGPELKKMRGKCLDIGSGPGDITKEMLLPILPHDAEIIGADISQTMVNYASQKYSDEKRLSYIVLDIETSELPNDQIGQYANILSFNCLHWCDDMWRAFENIYKLLQPNGKSLLMFLGYHCGFEAYIRLKQHPRYKSYLEDACRYIPYFQRKFAKNVIRASLRKMLEDIGFDILHCSLRETSYEFTKQTLKNHVCAVNPFIKRFDDDMKDDFVDDLISEVMSENVLIPFKNKNEKKYIIFRYHLLIAYVQKPSSTIGDGLKEC